MIYFVYYVLAGIITGALTGAVFWLLTVVNDNEDRSFTDDGTLTLVSISFLVPPLGWIILVLVGFGALVGLVKLGLRTLIHLVTPSETVE